MSVLLDAILKRTPLALIVVGILAVLVAAGEAFAGQPLAVRAPGNYVVGALGMVCFVVGIGLAVQEHLGSQPLPPLRLRRAPFGLPLVASAYPPGQAFRFYEDMRALVAKADEVRLIAMGLQILWVGNMLDVLVDRVRKGAKVTACMANPYNPAVLQRLIEEEMSDVPPQVRRKGIEGNIHTLLSRLRMEGNPDGFRFCLFEHYPTLATYIVDKDVFVAPYTYLRLGSDAPVLHLRDDGRDEVARFVVENAERMLQDAVPAAEIVRAHRDRRHFSAEWTAVCIAIVPDADETLYRFGSSVVGFDLWTGGLPSGAKKRTRQLTNAVGEAGSLGFHAPLVGPLYVLSNAEVRRIRADLVVMADEFHRFTLTRFRIEDRSDAGAGVVLGCDDESGVVEAMHNELVSRINRTAVSSSFLATRARHPVVAGPVPRRASLMIGRYGSADVLKGFELRFPLCAEPPQDPGARAVVVGQLQHAYSDAAPSGHLDVERIHLLVRGSHDRHGIVSRSYHLGGP